MKHRAVRPRAKPTRPARADLAALHAPRALLTRDARRARIRPARPSDAHALVALERAVYRAGTGVVRTIDQTHQTPAAARAYINAWRKTLRARSGVLLIALVEGPRAQALPAAYAKVDRHTPSRVRHVARLSVAVAPDFQGIGLGRALVEFMLDWCRATASPAHRDQGVNRVELNVFAENARAVALYSSLGFTVNAHRRRHLREPDGREHDDLEMSLLLDELPPPQPPNATGNPRRPSPK